MLQTAFENQQRGRANRRRRSRWPLAYFALAGAMAWALPGSQIRLGSQHLQGLVGSYLYQVGSPVQRPIQSLRLTDVYLPTTMRVAWDYTPLGSNPQYEVKRAGGSATPLDVNTTDKFLVDLFGYQFGTTYAYSVRVAQDSAGIAGLPGPPAGAKASDIYYYNYADGTPWTTITATPMQAVASDNQAVDSRYDLRYSTYTFLDHNFGATTYRGGLFAGFANDPSRVGRSFLKFQPPTLPTGNNLWTGNLNLYYTRSLANGSTNVAIQSVPANWTYDTIKWSTAPTFTVSGGTTVTYDGTDASSKWLQWNVGSVLASAVSSGQPFAYGLGSGDETSANWAYFAKKEFDASKAPNVTYAYGATVDVASLAITPGSVKGGTSATGTVVLNRIAPAGNITVTLTSSNGYASVPASVTVLAGNNQATFPITTYTVSSNQTALIKAQYTTTQSVNLTVTP